ncbi:hypothetical protein C882_4132 [Caenispirillum salinarum AK4]|uniref:Uncharacterized protein n=1 Tax=Caenispirillum salinarum AK4 TaxID=1238182 RepID=K9GXR7_9PROT|nr:hypothetical protein C882_4132 [Caenispirillum salinarum AK4]
MPRGVFQWGGKNHKKNPSFNMLTVGPQPVGDALMTVPIGIFDPLDGNMPARHIRLAPPPVADSRGRRRDAHRRQPARSYDAL